jgi:hypothetical protein
MFDVVCCDLLYLWGIRKLGFSKIKLNFGIFHANRRKKSVVFQSRLNVIGIIKDFAVFRPLYFQIVQVEPTSNYVVFTITLKIHNN